MALLTAVALVFLLNVPFGYWRAGVRKLSYQWMLAIHLPIPLVVVLRLGLGLGFHWTTYPALVGAFFIGQQLGALVRRRGLSPQPA